MRKIEAIKLLNQALQYESAEGIIDILEDMGFTPPNGFWEKEPALSKVFIIVNDNIKDVSVPSEFIKEENNLKYLIDDYGMGSVFWPIIDSPKDAYDRQCQENVLWAKQRIKWAVDNSPNELKELIEIIETNGTSRLPNYLEKFKTLKENKNA